LPSGTRRPFTRSHQRGGPPRACRCRESGAGMRYGSSMQPLDQQAQPLQWPWPGRQSQTTRPDEPPRSTAPAERVTEVLAAVDRPALLPASPGPPGPAARPRPGPEQQQLAGRHENGHVDNGATRASFGRRAPLRASPAVRILHQTMVQHQIMVRKGAQRSDLKCMIRTKCWDGADPTP